MNFFDIQSKRVLTHRERTSRLEGTAHFIYLC
jgi:hypothetical protein